MAVASLNFSRCLHLRRKLKGTICPLSSDPVCKTRESLHVLNSLCPVATVHPASYCTKTHWLDCSVKILSYHMSRSRIWWEVYETGAVFGGNFKVKSSNAELYQCLVDLGFYQPGIFLFWLKIISFGHNHVQYFSFVSTFGQLYEENDHSCSSCAEKRPWTPWQFLFHVNRSSKYKNISKYFLFIELQRVQNIFGPLEKKLNYEEIRQMEA